MQKWEYITKYLPSGTKTEELNKQGEQGWELVCVENHVYVFKRPKL